MCLFWVCVCFVLFRVRLCARLLLWVCSSVCYVSGVVLCVAVCVLGDVVFPRLCLLLRFLFCFGCLLRFVFI